jgi:hypothetical protein
MLIFMTILLMLITAYAYFREGLLTAVAMFCNVILSGLIAFNFWEPIAAELEGTVANTMFNGYEDCLCLMLLFCLPLGALRWLTNTLANTEIDYPPLMQQIGAVLFALMTGYLVAGFLVCVMQTLPWEERFLGFDPTVDARGGVRRVLPPDRVWLAMMYWAGKNGLGTSEGPTFDADGTFTARYGVGAPGRHKGRRYRAEPSKSE